MKPHLHYLGEMCLSNILYMNVYGGVLCVQCSTVEMTPQCQAEFLLTALQNVSTRFQLESKTSF